ncbi:nucleotidyltransferase [Vulcanimicrobium alpinum]|uniref:Nucleotidyltransferase n=2 Tax=Vulcanimicrobium alpinum TaxID=3016050 RepID=A0AAN1XU99_UNVUL|nr:nucleotidyltransferase [Vulcanimicrobium alpinum]
MAGGEGSRLRPLTSRRPKPLAPVAGIPVMEHIVNLLSAHGFGEIVATLHYLADEIEAWFGDGSANGVTMHYVVEDTPLGTAGAVKMANDLLAGDTFLIISGDALTDVDLSALVRHHKEQKNDVTIALQRVTNPLEFGVVVTGEDGRIVRFLEKPSWGEVFSDTINTGIYVLEPGILDLMERGKIYDFSKDLFPRMLHEGKKLGGWVFDTYWTDIGNLEQYQQANYDAIERKVAISFSGDEVRPGVWAGEGTTIDPQAHIEGPVVLGREVRVGAGATIVGPAVVGDHSIVERNAAITRSVLWEDCYVGEEASLNDCTVADRNTIERRATVQEASVIGRGCTLGHGSTVNAHLKLWPDKWVNAGSIVSMSLIYGQKWPGSLFGSVGISGLANLEITPEFALKLGQAFGTSLKSGQTVMTSRDTHPASRVMNRCVISGLLSVGINVLDLRSYPLPLARYAVRVGGDGGVHVRVAPDDANALVFEFFDHTGIGIEKGAERKVENLFFREDFRRTPMDEVGRLDFPSRALERYSGAFVESLGAKALKDANFRVVIDYAFGNASIVLPQILGTLGVEQIALNAYFDSEKVRTFRNDRERHLQQLTSVVSSLEANLGVLIDADGETVILVDDTGAIIGRNRLMALLTLLVARSKPGARIALPLTVPSVVERIAADNGATIVRTRSDRRSLMSLAECDPSIAFAGGMNYELIFPEFQPAFDGIYAAAKIMELLAAEQRKLSQLVATLPEWHIAGRVVACPWDRKGAVMRSLHDEAAHAGNGKVETLDGVRLERNGGWVLVLPDATDASVNIWAEGTTDDDAARYADEIAGRVRTIAAG